MQLKQSFTRTVSNLQKMGAYYTDLSHCRDICKMFRFENGTDKEGNVLQTCVLDPSIGDGSAVSAVTDVANNACIKIFGVELNDTVAEEIAKKPIFEQILKADFLDDFVCSNKVFSFVFGNPPYMDDEENGKMRVERRFLEKVTNYIMKGGILVWVIPYRIFMEDNYLSCWMGRYETLAFYKFREPEFSKFKQVVIVGKRTQSLGAVYKPMREAFQAKYATIDMVPELPSFFENQIAVPTSDVGSVTEFRARKYDADEAFQYLMTDPFSEVMDTLDKNITIKEAVEGIDGKAPIPLKKDSIYLVSTCGGGAGLTGTDGVDLHLQRGHAEVIEDIEAVTDPKTGSISQVVVSRTEISMMILENSGKITHLV